MTAQDARAARASHTEQPPGAVHEVLSGNPGEAGTRWLGILALVSLVLFVLDTVVVLSGALLRSVDIPVEHSVQAINWGPLADIMRLTNASGGWGQVILGIAAVVGLFLFERRAGFLMALGCIGSVIDSFLKVSIARHRPTTDIVSVLSPSKGFSYPSGHAVFFTWLAFMLAVALAPRIRPGLRPLLWGTALAVAVVACLGRVWAGAHWPTDVVGGFLLALAWSAFVLWLPERWLPSPSVAWIRGRLRHVRA
ncbi:MAG: hypothetical protein NVSMB17_05870 [Candidatus Dormibacteria bacterium]